eukprot:TRINITY_DN5518_c0_g1_i1.p2 TRINITY_DN5518_c0_g1~~TRINITY_DN5518_c0_g1_i1.p2  ORF type:complete len:429 (+),score=169.10 TRINITY_DN5518_c0_g1_i1:82-1368(+)
MLSDRAVREQYRDTILAAYRGFSLRDVYKFHCDKVGVRANSGARRALPTRVGDFGDVVEMDLSACNLGEAGTYPALEALRAAWNCEVLRLRDSGLTNDTVALICQVAESHPALRTVDLSGNRFVSQPAVDLSIRLARRRPQICSVLLEGCSAPREQVRRLSGLLAENRRKLAASGAPPELGHAVLFETGVDALPTQHRFCLSQPLLQRRLCEDLCTVVKHHISTKEDAFLLPDLLRWELDQAAACFREQDTSTSGLLGHRRTCLALSAMTGTQITQEDAEVEHLFNRCDTNDDGFIETDQYFVVVRNHLAMRAEEVKSVLIAQLAKAYQQALPEGSGQMVLTGLAAGVANYGAICGQRPPAAVEETARAVAMAATGATALNEDKVVLSQQLFVQVVVAGLCGCDEAVRHAVICHKYLVPRRATAPSAP